MIPHRAGSRISRGSGETIFVFEFKRVPHPSQNLFWENLAMNAIENFVSDLLLKAVRKSVPALAPTDDAKVRKLVSDLVTIAVDATAVFFAIRAASQAKG